MLHTRTTIILFFLVASVAWAAESQVPIETKRVTFDLSNIPERQPRPQVKTREASRMVKRDKVHEFQKRPSSPTSLPDDANSTRFQIDATPHTNEGRITTTKMDKTSSTFQSRGPSDVDKAPHHYSPETKPRLTKSSIQRAPTTSIQSSPISISFSPFKSIKSLAEIQAALHHNLPVGVLITSTLSHASQECLKLAKDKTVLEPYHDKVIFLEVDLFEIEMMSLQEILRTYQVDSLPAFLLFKQGKLETFLYQPDINHILGVLKGI